jgi:hypothetical protein
MLMTTDLGLVLCVLCSALRLLLGVLRSTLGLLALLRGGVVCRAGGVLQNVHSSSVAKMVADRRQQCLCSLCMHVCCALRMCAARFTCTMKLDELRVGFSLHGVTPWFAPWPRRPSSMPGRPPGRPSPERTQPPPAPSACPKTNNAATSVPMRTMNPCMILNSNAMAAASGTWNNLVFPGLACSAVSFVCSLASPALSWT